MRPPQKNLPPLLIALTLFMASPALAASELPALDTWRFSLPVETLHVTSAHDLEKLFAAKDYLLPEAAADGRIPRLYLRRLVDDLHTFEPVRDREALFIRIVLPLVVRANAEILAQRRLLEAIAEKHASGTSIPASQEAWLADLGRLYDGHGEATTALLERVDAVPPSLAIAQAIDESGWGTGHLALESNGMFGQHAPHGLGRRRIKATGTNVDVAAFPSLLDGVLAYMTNINSNRAYAELRALRAEHRRAGKAPNGYALAAGLAHYSQRGMTYVEALRRLIRRHDLETYDTMTLAPGGAVLIHASR